MCEYNYFFKTLSFKKNLSKIRIHFKLTLSKLGHIFIVWITTLYQEGGYVPTYGDCKHKSCTYPKGSCRYMNNS